MSTWTAFLRATLVACALATLASAGLAASSPTSAQACGTTNWSIGTSYGWSEGQIYVSGYYVYAVGGGCASEYLDQTLPPEEPPPPSACDVDPASRACVRETLEGDVAAALRLPACNALVSSFTNAQYVFNELIAHGRLADGGTPTGAGAGAVASADEGGGHTPSTALITLWDAFYANRPALFPNDQASQAERRANIVLEELGHLTSAVPENHDWYSTSGLRGQEAWNAAIRERCQPASSQSGVATAQAAR